MHLQQTAIENNVGKEENAGNEQFLHFPQCFPLNQIHVLVSPFINIDDIISLFAAELEEPKIGILGKGLTNKYSCLSDRDTFQFQNF